MKRVLGWLLALGALLIGRPRAGSAGATGEKEEEEQEAGRIVPAGPHDRRAENVVLALLVGVTLCGAGFMVVYATDSLGNQTQLLGIVLGLGLVLAAIALIVLAERLIVTEENEEEYPEEQHPEAQEEIVETLHESTSRFTRKKLLVAAGGTAASAMGLAAITPALSLGPWLETNPLYATPWRRGRGLVDSEGKPLRAEDIEADTFYSAYPEGATEDERDQIGAPVVLVRLPTTDLRLPPERARWAPNGILGFSKICTHAACAIALYRKPTFAPVQPRPALVCPCHYSTFDPARGGEVIFGPAGRPLPQLPLAIDAHGLLRAAGNFSGPVGPSWQGVRGQGASSS